MGKRSEVAEMLRQHVVSGLHFGTLPRDGRLPSARRLAGQLKADPRVVVAAYRELEREGLVERRPRSRAFFASTAHVTHTSVGPTAEWLVDVLADALSRGVRTPEFPEHARRAVETLRLRAACVECNTDQLVWLCREVHEDYGIEATAVEVGEIREREAVPASVRSADVLVTTASHAAEVRRVAARLEKACVVATLRSDLVDEIARLLAAGPVYFIGTDARYAGKVRRLFRALAGGANARPVILGWGDPHDIPDGSPAYVMRTAREALGGVPANVRALSTLRAFSPATRRELLEILVRANMAAVATRGSRGAGPAPRDRPASSRRPHVESR